MINSTPPPTKQAPKPQQVSRPQTLLGRYQALPQKKLLLASILMHLAFFSLLFVHWENTEPTKPLHIPSNIQARIVSEEQLEALQATKEDQKKQLLEQQKMAEQQRQAQLEKEQAKQRVKEEAQKKAAEEKKLVEDNKLKLKKQKEEQERIEKARIEKEKQQKDLAKQKQLDQEKKLAKEKELLEKQKAEKLKAEKLKEIKEKEQQMLDKLKAMEQRQAQARKQAEFEAEQLRQLQAFQVYELTEVERFLALIKARIENLWRIPPKSDGLSITLRIRLLPNGELSSVEIINSSGNNAFDRSALLAVKSVTKYPVPDDGRVFEKNFRQFSMAFRPETN